MIKIEGTYNTAIVYADTIEAGAEGQIQKLVSQEFTKGSRIRIMPDVHAGKGCTIGTTMTITDKIVPNLVGHWLRHRNGGTESQENQPAGTGQFHSQEYSLRL